MTGSKLSEDCLNNASTVYVYVDVCINQYTHIKKSESASLRITKSLRRTKPQNLEGVSLLHLPNLTYLSSVLHFI